MLSYIFTVYKSGSQNVITYIERITWKQSLLMYTEKEFSNVTQTDTEGHLEVLEIGCSFNLGDENCNIFLLFQILQLQVLLRSP